MPREARRPVPAVASQSVRAVTDQAQPAADDVGFVPLEQDGRPEVVRWRASPRRPDRQRWPGLSARGILSEFAVVRREDDPSPAPRNATCYEIEAPHQQQVALRGQGGGRGRQRRGSGGHSASAHRSTAAGPRSSGSPRPSRSRAATPVPAGHRDYLGTTLQYELPGHPGSEVAHHADAGLQSRLGAEDGGAGIPHRAGDHPEHAARILVVLLRWPGDAAAGLEWDPLDDVTTPLNSAAWWRPALRRPVPR